MKARQPEPAHVDALARHLVAAEREALLIIRLGGQPLRWMGKVARAHTLLQAARLELPGDHPFDPRAP